MHKIIFGTFVDRPWEHPGYLYLKEEARKEGWSGTPGLKGLVEERWGKNARIYFRHGDIYGIGFKHVQDYNSFAMASGANAQMEMF